MLPAAVVEALTGCKGNNHQWPAYRLRWKLMECAELCVDVVLPQMNGLEVCRRYREQSGYSVPVLMLTALGSTDDIVVGLDSGADDYLVKPFRFKELNARINAMLRRKSNAHTTPELKFADLVLNLDSITVTRSGREILLTSKEFRLLEFFMNNPRRVLSRTSIFESVWDANYDMNTNIVDVYIKYLRDKIDKDFNSKLIHTVIGMGYVLKEE